MTVARALKRKFIFKKIELKPNSIHDTADLVRDKYIGIYPDLLNTRTKTSKDKDDDSIEIIEFVPKTGGHG